MLRKRGVRLACVALLILALLATSFVSILRTSKTSFADTLNASESERYNCKSALIMDYNSGKILLTQNENQRLPIASMVKTMTLNLIFDAIDNGQLKLDDMITISQHASSMGGSQAFLDTNLSYTADELIKSIIVASANDSCVALAEHLAGSDTEFVSRMNERAIELGMNNTKFVNCTGLPAEGQYSCAVDVAIMFRQLITNGHFFDYSKIWMYDINHPDGRMTSLTNTNKLVRFYNGCDGGKTGFTKEALSCLVATAKRGDTRLIAVAIASPSAKERNAEVTKMFNYGFANFETKKVVDESADLQEYAVVDGGKEDKVPVKASKGYYHLVKKGEKPEFDCKIETNKLKAPIKTGDIVGKITVSIGGENVSEIDLLATQDVQKASFLDNLNDLISSW